MKFFMPAAKDDQQAEEVLDGIKKFAKENTGWEIGDEKIYSLSYSHEGKEYLAKVGEYSSRNKDLILAILKSNTYLICTINQGGIKGMPMLVGFNEVAGIEYFDE